MKINILPDNSKKNRAPEPAPVFKPYYTGSSKVLAFLGNNLLYLISFLFPVIVLFTLIAVNGFAPFGDKNLFILDGSVYNLPHFATFVEQLHSGNFSFFMEGGVLGKEYFSTIVFYLTSPLHLLLCFFSQKTAIVLLAVVTVLQIGFAGLAMTFYLTHRLQGYQYSKYDYSVLLFSFAFSLSGYFLVQYNDFMYLDCVVLFPLLFLALEHLLYKNTYKYFYGLLAFCFFCNFYMAAIIFVLLFFYVLTRKKGDFTNSVAKCIKYLFTGIFAALTSAVTVIPGFYSLYQTQIKTSSAPDFSFVTDWLSFYGSFMPKNFGSYATTASCGNNLYCSLFAIILLTLYFMDKNNKFSDRFRNGCFLLFLCLISNIVSFQYAFHLLSLPDSSFNCYSFLLPFFTVVFCSDSLYNFRSNAAYKNIFSLVLPLALMIIASVKSAFYSSSVSISFTLIMFVTYILTILFYRLGSINRNALRFIILCLVSIELVITAKQNFSYISIDSDSVDASMVTLPKDPSAYTPSPFSIDMDETLQLPAAYYLNHEYTPVKDSYNTEFSEQNAIAYSLEATEDLFNDIALDVAYKDTKDVYVKLSSNNILSVKVAPDSLKAKNRYTTLKLTITPSESGDLYLFTNQLEHVGSVTAGKPFQYKLVFDTTTNVWENYWIRGAIFNASVLHTLQDAIEKNTISISTITNKGFSVDLSAISDGTLVCNAPYSKFASVTVDQKEVSLQKGPSDTMAISVSAGTHTITIQYCYIPILIGLVITLCSFISLFVLYHSEVFGYVTSNLKKYFYHILRSFELHIKHYYIGYIAFLIPFILLTVVCIIKGYTPFGPNSFIHHDGIAGTIPCIYQFRDQSSRNSFLYTWTTGGGSNFFYAAPYAIFYYWTRFVSASSILSIFTMIDICAISFSALAMYFYLTHRQIGIKMHHKDYRILIFTTAYALNAYMLNFRHYIPWMVLFALLPLLLLALDQVLLYNKKTAYILILGFCITFSFNIAFFFCIFLVLLFFTYPFADIKDFIKKGIRFAYASLLSAGIVFFSLAATYLSTQMTAYSNADSIPPSFHFYQSFWDTFKQTFLFAEPITITENNGAINLYCGIFCLILVTLSLFIKHKKDIYLKYSYILFILFSSNNDILSYIWNGFHYQSKVPNRYSFILIFLLIDISSNALYSLKKINKHKLLISTIMLTVFYVLVITLSSLDCNSISFITTGIVLLILMGLLWLTLYAKSHRRLWKQLLFFVTLFELLIGSSYVLFTEEYTNGKIIDYFDDSIVFYKETINDTPLQDRILFTDLTLNNQSMISSVNSFKYFNSFLTPYQSSIARAHGLTSSSNFLDVVNNTTPFDNAILNNRYIILNTYTNEISYDIEHYKPIAYTQDFIFWENEKALSVGYYIQKEALDKIYNSNIVINEDYANKLSSGYTRKSIFTDLFEVTDDNSSLYSKICTTKVYHSSTDTLRQILYIIPQKTGTYYFRSNEYFYLGKLEAGKHYQFNITCSYPEGTGYLSIFHEDAFEEFYEGASKYTMDVSEFEDTSVRGTITLPEEGYIYLSIPYERGWSATVDGKEAAVETAPDGFSMIKASAGTHEVHLTFRPYGLTVCIVGTLIAWIIFLFTILFERRHNKRMLLKAAEADTTLPPAHLQSHQQAEESHCELPQACSSAPQAPQEGSLPGTACYTDTLSDRSGGQAPDSIADTSAASEMKMQD